MYTIRSEELGMRSYLMRFRALNFKTHTADGGFKAFIPERKRDT